MLKLTVQGYFSSRENDQREFRPQRLQLLDARLDVSGIACQHHLRAQIRQRLQRAHYCQLERLLVCCMDPSYKNRMPRPPYLLGRKFDAVLYGAHSAFQIRINCCLICRWAAISIPKIKVPLV